MKTVLMIIMLYSAGGNGGVFATQAIVSRDECQKVQQHFAAKRLGDAPYGEVLCVEMP